MNIIRKYKIDGALLALSVLPLLSIFPSVAQLLTNSEADQYALQAHCIIASLALFFVACLLHASSKIAQAIQDKSIDNILHYGALLIFAIIIGINHLKFHFDVDDLFYQNRFAEIPFLQVLTELYAHTTPCVLIHALVGTFVYFDPIVWRVFDTLVMTLCVEMVLRLFVPKNRMRYAPLFISFAILIPKATFCNTGWCATTLNYLWPGTASLILYYFHKRVLEGKISSPFIYAISFPLILFACNSIQSATLYFCITLSIIGWVAFQKKSFLSVDRYFYFAITCASASFLFILLCPGNVIRAAHEMQTWFPDFEGFNTIQKLHMGFINTCTFFWSTGKWCIMKNHFPFVVLPLSILLVFRMLKQHKNSLLVISALTILLFTILPYLNFCLTRFTSITCPILDYFQQRNIYEGEAHISRIFIPTIGYLFLMECLLIGIYDTFKDDMRYAVLMILIFIAGFCSSLMLSFSPTLFASGERVLLFQAISILMVTIAAYVKSIDDQTLSDKMVLAICLFLAIFIPSVNELKYTPLYHNPFSETNIRRSEGFKPANYMFIDMVNGQIANNQITLTNDSTLSLRGWAYDGIEKCRLGEIYVQTGQRIIIGQFDEPRQDVKNIFGLTDDTLGFHIEIPTRYITQDTMVFGLVGKEREYMYEPVVYTLISPSKHD